MQRVAHSKVHFEVCYMMFPAVVFLTFSRIFFVSYSTVQYTQFLKLMLKISFLGGLLQQEWSFTLGHKCTCQPSVTRMFQTFQHCTTNSQDDCHTNNNLHWEAHHTVEVQRIGWGFMTPLRSPFLKTIVSIDQVMQEVKRTTEGYFHF